VYVTDAHDSQLVETIRRVVEEFGGEFTVESGMPWRSTASKWKQSGGKIVHLTAYGVSLRKVIGEIRRSKSSKLIVVGAEKMPGEVFHIADWNVAVTNQPISEVSALGIFLDWLFKHRLREDFRGAKIRILPSERGKRIIKN
jgi:tRNA (cytidine56-2'-O)-methyltransferase